MGDARIQLLKGGSGPPLLFLHGASGILGGWQTYHQALAESYTVYAPYHPGYNKSQRPGWIETITDLAHFYLDFVRQLNLGRYILIGSSMGGWLAAEMAAMCHHDLRGLVLVNAVGIKPEVGEIAEVFMVSGETRKKLRFYDPSQVPNYELYDHELTPEEQEIEFSNREMASRLCWRPYMHNPKLPTYLKTVPTRTLIAWGRQDAIVPVNCAELYQKALANSHLQVIENCGHFPYLEKPQEFDRVVREFLSTL